MHRAGGRSDWTQPRDGCDRVRAHGALPAEPAGDLGECPWLPAPVLVPRLLSHPPRVTADLTHWGGGCGWQAVRGLRGLSRCSQLGSGQWPGVRRCFQLWSRCSLCRTPQCSSPGLWVHLSLPGCWAASPGVDRVDVVAVAPVD